MFQTASGAAMNTKLKTLQNIRLGAGESIIEYWNRILQLITELEWTGHATSRIEQKRALIPGLPTDFDATTK